jgi:hypothetical protein
MYLPPEIHSARVLITVKTYPLPSGKYGELVCTAGLLDGEKWVRIYPVPYRFLADGKKYPKYSWIELDLIRNGKDFRPESYRPHNGIDEEIRVIEKVSTAREWATRKNLVLKEIFTSMQELIALAKGTEQKSLATLKPLEILDFMIEDDDRHWKEKWLAQAKQGHFFEILDSDYPSQEPHPVRKLPYKYSYRFLSRGDDRPRELMIEDWELGALFWRCLNKTGGDEQEANRLVRQKYLNEFREKKDLYFFVGTSRRYHKVSPNPFMIIGVFYPPKTIQTSIF